VSATKRNIAPVAKSKIIVLLLAICPEKLKRLGANKSRNPIQIQKTPATSGSQKAAFFIAIFLPDLISLIPGALIGQQTEYEVHQNQRHSITSLKRLTVAKNSGYPYYLSVERSATTPWRYPMKFRENQFTWRNQ
jgi:hypothetical protein